MIFRFQGLLLVAALVAGACSGSGGTAPADAVAEAFVEVQQDLVASETAAIPKGCEPILQGTLPPGPEAPDKFALSMYHFNLQYVAGGLTGIIDNPDMEFNEEEIEDRIIVESFEPILDVLLDHPAWGFDLEMQGYMLEVISVRHPEILTKMIGLVKAGQIHIDSFHYSDQLWTAHPLPSMLKSFEMNDEVFDSLCLPMGRAVFTQEGQYGLGLAHQIKDSGRVGLVAINLFKYFHDPPGAVELMYDSDGTRVLVVGRDATGSAGGKEIQVTWHFFDDGELATTGGANPYFGKAFAYDASYTAAWVEELEDMEAAGWRIATVADYVDHVESYGFDAPELPSVPDGAWQPADTVNVQRWMGLAGNFAEDENDNGVLTAVTRSRFMLQAADALAAEAAVSGAIGDDIAGDLAAGWQHQLLAEVSDSTGWNPWKGEVEYSLGHADEALVRGYEVAVDLLEGAAFPRRVDTGSDDSPPVSYRVEPGGVIALVAECEEAAAPVEPVVTAEGREVSQTWCVLGGGQHLLHIDFAVGGTPDSIVRVEFPRFGDTLSYVPALMEEEAYVATVDVSTVVGQEGAPDLALALANGLIGLGGDRWLVKVNVLIHLAALLPAKEQVVVFLDETSPVDKEFRWSYFYLEDATVEEAVEFANRVNVYPVLEFHQPEG